MRPIVSWARLSACVFLLAASGCEYAVDDIPGKLRAVDAGDADASADAIDDTPGEDRTSGEVTSIDAPSDAGAGAGADVDAGEPYADAAAEGSSLAPEAGRDGSGDERDDAPDTALDAATADAPTDATVDRPWSDADTADVDVNDICPAPADGGASSSSQPPPIGHVAVGSADAKTSVVLSVGVDGALYARTLFRDCPWRVKALTAPDFAPPGASIAVRQSPVDGFDAYLVGDDGFISQFSLRGGSTWSGPVHVGAAGFAPPGAFLSTMTMLDGEDTIFGVSGTGAVQMISLSSAGDGGDGGDGGDAIAWSPPNLAPPGAPLATIDDIAGMVGVVIIGNDGALNLMAMDGADAGVNGPFSSLPGVASPGGSIDAALHRPGQVDCYFAGSDGAIKVFWYDEQGWHSPANVSNTQFALPGAHMSTVRDEGGPHLDIFVVSKFGNVSVLWVDPSGPFFGPSAIPGAQGLAESGAASAEIMHWGNRLEVITVGSAGLFETWISGNPWHGPFYLP